MYSVEILTEGIPSLDCTKIDGMSAGSLGSISFFAARINSLALAGVFTPTSTSTTMRAGCAAIITH